MLPLMKAFEKTELVVIPADPAQSGAERYAGFVISVAFHVSFFALLYTQTQPRVAHSSPEETPIRVALKDLPPLVRAEEAQVAAVEATPEPTPEATPEPTPEPQAVADAAPPPPPPPASLFAAATAAERLLEQEQEAAGPVEEQGEENGTGQAAASAAPDAGQSAAETAIETANPIPAQATTGDAPAETLAEGGLEAELNETKARLSEANRTIARKGSDHVAERIKAAEVQLQGKKWLTETKGVKEGVIRSINTDDVPQPVAQQVLARYGIRIGMADLRPGAGSGGYGFLNQARTQEGTFMNRVGGGKAEVFSYGPAAIARMMQLEEDGLRKRGFDPARTRVIEIEYGIVNTTNGYDLGVKKLETAPVPPAQK